MGFNDCVHEVHRYISHSDVDIDLKTRLYEHLASYVQDVTSQHQRILLNPAKSMADYNFINTKTSLDKDVHIPYSTNFIYNATMHKEIETRQRLSFTNQPMFPTKIAIHPEQNLNLVDSESPCDLRLNTAKTIESDDDDDKDDVSDDDDGGDDDGHQRGRHGIEAAGTPDNSFSESDSDVNVDPHESTDMWRPW